MEPKRPKIEPVHQPVDKAKPTIDMCARSENSLVKCDQSERQGTMHWPIIMEMIVTLSCWVDAK